MSSTASMLDISNGIRSRLARFAIRHIRHAGRICRRHFAIGFSHGRGIEYKDDGSPVTMADREVERYLTQAIRTSFPDHAIIGEEYRPTATATEREFVWYIDPIDGTFSFIHHIPLYSCLLALYHDGEPLLGLIYNPELDELVIAIRGAGCYFNGKPTTVSHCATLNEARMLCTELPLLLRTAPQAQQLLERCRSMRTWCDAYGYVLLVTGRGDLVLDAGMKPWDVAPLYIVTHEAGGIIGDFSGTAAHPLGANAMAAAAGGVYEEALSTMRNEIIVV